MTISVTCGECGKRYRLSDDKGGRSLRRKECSALVTVMPFLDAPAARSGIVIDTALPSVRERVEDHQPTEGEQWQSDGNAGWCNVLSVLSMFDPAA
jgi:hypothetical protein